MSDENQETAAAPGDSPNPSAVEAVTPSDTAQPAVDEISLEPWPAATNVTQELEVFSPLPKEMKSEVTIALPSDTDERTSAVLAKYPNVDYENSEGGAEWANTLAQAQMSISYKGQFRRTVDRPDSNFRQMVPSEKGPLAAGTPRFKENTGGTSWTGEKAVLRVRALMGVGSIVQVPLWHSGFWITLKAPTEGAVLELNRRLAEEKIILGRLTHGLAFANNSVFFAGWLMDFALSHIYETSLKPELLETKSLRDRISCLDIPILAWGLACVIWPRGFPYARAVLDAKTQETKVVKELVSVGKLLWTDLASLTPWQIGHMANRHGGNMSEEALERYKNDFTRGKGRQIKFSEQLSFTTKVPSLNEYLVSGQKWVNSIVSTVDKAFGTPPGDSTRNQYILDQGKASNMRQYVHWVESLSAGEDGVIDHPETIELTLDALSSSDEYRKIYFDEVRNFIEDSTIAVIAVPATEEGDKPPLPRFPHLLPIDAMSVFFTLLVQKADQIQSR